MSFTTIITEGSLLPAEILAAVADGSAQGQRAEDFGLDKGVRLSDEIAAAWGDARSYWDTFQRRLNRLRSSDSPTTLTREQWIAPLLELLGYRLSYQPSATIVEGRTYAISHRAGDAEGVPVHIEGIDKKLDERPPSGRPRLSPHGLVQEYLNSTEQVWGIVTNGERLRLLRDSSRFTRPAYVEFDLRPMLEGEKFSEFALLYRLLHRSRLPQPDADAASCLLEKYHQQAIEAGGRVREGLRDGVEAALKRLGTGLLQHPANADLRRKLAAGELSTLGYYRQLLRLVYRLLFLMVAEERNLIAAGDAHHKGTKTQSEDDLDLLLQRAQTLPPDAAIRIYYDYYSVSRLRKLAEASGVGRGPYDDLWQSLLTTFELLEGSDEQRPRALGLAALDGDLFSYAACADLTSETQLRNSDLLATVRALSLYREKESKSLRRVNYAALDVEELGSVYESLLDYRPVVTITNNQLKMQKESSASSPDAEKDFGYFALGFGYFDLVAGTERKTTGSYYTRPELVQELIKSALDPVVEERLKAAGSDPRAQERALLAITVCDPACGSGHFLLAAARRIGRALARVRSGEDQPTPTQFRKAVRDVIGRCIFGVDLNPLAVDLCKLALWIEGHNAGMPLSFLDHHIKQGNSLIGATRKLVEAGIPDDAYKAVTGDDKKVASEIRKRNKKEREQAALGMAQQTLFDAPAAEASPSLAEALRRLDAQADDSVASVRARAAAYKKLREDYSAEHTLFDLWTAAFFQPLTLENAQFVPTTKDLLNPKRGDIKAIKAEALAQEVGFFHWELEFPQVFQITNNQLKITNDGTFSSNGFDVVLGNPPWERIKLQEQEHWVDVTEVRDAPNKAAREKVIVAWRASDDPVKQARVARFDFAKYQAEAESRFVRASSRFPLTAVGDVNTYALFAEHFRLLIAPTGRAGVIVPTGIATDSSTSAFFGNLIAQRHLTSLYDFENREDIFPGVGHGRFKFSLLTLGATQQPIQFVFFATNVGHLTDSLRRFSLSPDEIALLNPNTHTCPIFRTSTDAELTKRLYRRVPVLINEISGTNPWGVSFLRMFDMSNDSGLFETAPGDGLLPLYEGRMVWFYDHRFGSFDTQAREYLNVSGRDPYAKAQTEYFVPQQETKRRIQGREWQRQWFFGIRRVTNGGNERTVIGSFLPYSAVTYGLYLVLSSANVQNYICLGVIFNSLIFDQLCRTSTNQPSLTYGILYQLPVLPPDRFSAEDIAFIVPRVVELVYTAWDIKAFAEDVLAELRMQNEECRKRTGADDPAAVALLSDIVCRNAECNADAPRELFPPIAGLREDGIIDPQFFILNSPFSIPPFRWSEERRALTRAELDARIARLYGLTRDELRYILDPADVYGPDFPGETFRVLKEKEIKLYGEYRTRRLVLEAWDRENNQ